MDRICYLDLGCGVFWLMCMRGFSGGMLWFSRVDFLFAFTREEDDDEPDTGIYEILMHTCQLFKTSEVSVVP